jgi:hypothetical protein
MAFMMIMFQLEEEGEKVFTENSNKNKSAIALLESYKNWFKKD